VADVFISYSKADRAVAEALAADLKAQGFDVWWDFELYAGDDFHDMIRGEIAKAKAVVVIWSERAVASKWVRGEAEEASDLGTLICTHAPGFDPRKMPLNFRALHCEPVVNRERVIAAIARKGAKAKAEPRPPDPIADLRARAEAGNADAQDNLGVMYATGRGVAKDDTEAARLYRLAADQGHAGGQFNLGWMYANGKGVAKDDAEAVRLFRLAADQGQAEAQSNLGLMYANGSGVAKDDAKAVRLLRLAADQGQAEAQSNLGLMYLTGRGVAKDEAEAGRLFRLAAAQGVAFAQIVLAGMYEEGWGVAKDDAEAVRLYRLAAGQGYADAKAALKRLGK